MFFFLFHLIELLFGRFLALHLCVILVKYALISDNERIKDLFRLLLFILQIRARVNFLCLTGPFQFNLI